MKRRTNIIYSACALFALACFALSPQARAQCQEGCLSTLSTVLGQDALLNNFGFYNTAVGFHALSGLHSTGGSNTAIGAFALEANTTGDNNTAVGDSALASNTFGVVNTAIGGSALFSNTSGIRNTACGFNALEENTTGDDNTAIGVDALLGNTSGDENTVIGSLALESNSTGSKNTATGFLALEANTTGGNNTATGADTLEANTTGINNTATGVDALTDNTEGSQNTATGSGVLFSNTDGSSNTASGFDALFSNTDGSSNTASGFNALLNNTSGNNNIALGFRAGSDLTTGDNNIDIGNTGQAGESSTIRIGRVQDHTATFIAGIAGATVPTGVAVIVNANGHLGTTTSSARFKEAIKPMDKASEAILALKPVTFRYKHDLDPEGIPQFGLVAEEVEKVNPYLVARDEQGKPYTVRYEAVNAMLLNEFLKEHRTVQEQGATIARLSKQVEALSAGLQKVSAQLELSKSAPHTVLNDQ